MEADSSLSRLQAGAASAIIPSGNGAAKKSSSSASLALPTSSQSGNAFPNPITRTQSACFPVTKTPSAKGLAMIKTTESTPPPTNMSFEEALALLHKLEKQLTVEVQNDIEIMRFRMTASKIELVARKSLRLYQMRVLLNQTRKLCREEEDVMGDFGSMKTVIDSAPRGQIDEDDYMDTKSKLLKLGGRLTDIRRKQQKLAGQVEDLQAAMRQLVDMSQLADVEDYEFNMESFKRESSAMPEMPRLTTTLPSYDLFNSAPYSTRDSRPSSAMSMDSDRPMSAASMHEKRRTIKLSVTTADSTDDEDHTAEAYYPQKSGARKKKDLLSVTRRRNAPSETSDTEGEDCYQVFQNRMTPQEAKQKAEDDRKRAAEEEERIQKEIDEQLRKEEEETKLREEEIAKKKKEDDEKKKAMMAAKQKAAAERAAELEAKKKAEEEIKAAEAESKRKEELAKKKATADAKKAKDEEAKKKMEEAEAAKMIRAEEERKKKEAVQRKREEEVQAAKQAELEAKEKHEREELQKKKEVEAAIKAEKEEREKKEKEEVQMRLKEESIALKNKEEEEEEAVRQVNEAASASKGKRESFGKVQDELHQLDRTKCSDDIIEEDIFKRPASIVNKSRASYRTSRSDSAQREVEDESQQPQPSKGNRKSSRERHGSNTEASANSRPSSSNGEKIGATESSKSVHKVYDDEMLYDEKSQILTKEDLFAAISDTSLKSAKKSRQRRRVSNEQELEDSDDDVPAKRQLYKSRTASRDRQNNQHSGTSLEFDESEETKPKAKSRTSSKERVKSQVGGLSEETKLRTLSRANSGERPKSQGPSSDAGNHPMNRQFFDESQNISSVKSRDPSRERPGALPVEESFEDMEVEKYLLSNSTQRSRASSREGRHSRDGKHSRDEMVDGDTCHYTADGSDDTYVSIRPKSRGSRPASADFLEHSQLGRGMQGSRPPSRYSDMMSENLDPELQWDDEEELEDENMPSLAELSALGRNTSRERPSSKSSLTKSSRPSSRDAITEGDKFTQSLPRPGSRTLAQEEELLRIASEQNLRGAKSRTSSRDRLKQTEDDIHRGTKSRTSSRDRLKLDSSEATFGPIAQSGRSNSQQYLDDEFEQEELALSQRGLRERPQAIYDEEFEKEEELRSKPRGAKSRTQSRERAPTMGLSPRSSFGEADLKGSSSRTASRERPLSQGADDSRMRSRTSSRDGQLNAAEAPMWPEESSDSELGSRRQQPRSRTSSTDRKKLVGGGREDLLAEDLGYDTLPSGPSPSGFRSYRDEIELDTQQYAQQYPQQYETGTMDSGVAESYHSACDRFEDDEDEPPPSEPIYDRSEDYPDGATARPRNRFPTYHDRNLATARDNFENIPPDDLGNLDARYMYDEEQYASEVDHEDDKDALSKSNKKVSFAEADQKIILKPDPDVKSIPGTKLFCFAPSSTHEQPPEDQQPAAGMNARTSMSEDVACEPSAAQPSSTSPKSFLKAMTKGIKSQPKAREERGSSLIDSIFRRGRSSSAHGSRSSSRQSSLDRAERGKPGGSSRSDHSTGSIDNFDEMSETESVSSFFKKKKPKKVNTVDFDELFARGHAMSAQIEQTISQPLSNDGYGLRAEVIGPTIHPNQNDPSSTPFEVYSKDEAFKKSQKAAGIGYAEKVQSYLTDQQSTKGNPFKSLEQEQHNQANEVSDATQEMRLSSANEGSNIQQFIQPSQSQPESPKAHGSQAFSKGSGRTNMSPVPQSVSPTPSGIRAKKQMTPQEFLSRIQEFVQKAEMDSGYSQPVWPAVVQSPNDMPPIKLHSNSSCLPSSRKTSNENYNLNAPLIETSTGLQSHDNQLVNHKAEPPKSPSKMSSHEHDNQYFFNKHFSLSPPNIIAPDDVPIIRRKNSYSTAGNPPLLPEHPENVSFPTETSPRLAPPGYAPKPRDHSPFRPQEPSVFDAALGRPMSKAHEDSHQMYQQQDHSISRPYKGQQMKVAPSPGKSYLDKPSFSPDPFGDTVEMDAPPSANVAAAATSTILTKLRQQANQYKQPPENISLSHDYLPAPSHYDQFGLAPVPSPRRGRSPAHLPPLAIPADRHIPNQLKPDPLTGHENSFRQSQSLIPAYTDDYVPSIQETDLYRKLQIGIDKLMQSDRFRELAARSEARLNADPSLYSDPSSYSHHLGRAEFGVLKKKTGSMQAIGNPMSGGEKGASYRARDFSNERPASAMAKISGGGRRSTFSSHQASRDSSLGRHDYSRVSSNSNIPDLETQDAGIIMRPSTSGLKGQNLHHSSSQAINIEPHPEVIEKKKEVLQDLAVQKQAVKEAKVWVQVLLLFILCLCVLVYLQAEG